MTRRRIDFKSADAAQFNYWRDQWRSMAAGSALSKAALRVAAVLPQFVNRQQGYAYPKDDDIADKIGASRETAKRGIADLASARLIERDTRVVRGEGGAVIGRERRIYLSTPPKGQPSEGKRTEGSNRRRISPPKGHTGDPIYPERQIHRGRKNSTDVSVEREGFPVAHRGDAAFLDGFDRAFLSLAGGRQLEAGELGRLVERAFDDTTRANDRFMPFHWRDVCALRSRDTEHWFIRRAGQLNRL